ncbi:MAG: leucine-rich repeat protein, partial [Eubacterium sp.]
PETLTGFRTGAFYNSQITKLELSEKISGAKSDVFKNCPITEVTVYNPNFNFYDNTFSGENTTIKGYRGSTAALFAGENNMTFIALESGDTETPVIPGDPDTAVPTSGTFDGGTWIVTGGNELVISGEGDITTSTAYDNDGNEYTFAKIAGLNNVKAVIVCYGITSLPEKFLYGTKFLTESSMTVTLPDTLIAIGNNAFRYTNLTYIDIPDSVTSIGEYAFYEAGLANGVKLSNSLTAINQYVFANNDFSSIGIPNSVTDIELAAFNNCNSLVNMYIPETVTTINEGASTTKPVGFTSSGDKLEDFTIECKLDSRAYQYAVTNGINTKLDMESGYASGYYSTRSCAKWYYYPDTKEFYFVSNGVQPSDNTFYHSDGTAITDGELDIDSLIVCYGVTDFSGINGESIFKVLNPKTITLPETVVSIGDNAFSGLTKLKSTKIPDNATTLSATAFNNCNIEAISFGNGIKTIPDYMFKDNKTLKYIDFGSVHTIGKGAFQSCTALEEIDIPYFTRTVGESAFEKCLSVKSVTIEYGYPLTVGEKAFADLPLCDTVEFNRTTVHYTDGTDESIFRNLGSGTTGIYLSVGDESDQLNHSTDLSLFIKKNIVELNIGESITKINNAESFPYLKNISVDDANETFFSYGGCLYDRSNEDGNIILIMAPSNLKEVEIYEGTRWIWPYAFYESKIEHIEIPEGVTLIGDYAFYGCTELRKVTFPSTLEGIYNNAFENCTKLKIIDLPSVIYICNSAFKNCTSLASIILPDNLMSIDPCAFAGCTSLTGLVMPNNESYLCSIVFENCTSLTDVYMWNNDFAPDTFIGCDNVVIHTLVGTDSYALAKEYGLNCVAYTDENVFSDECAMMEDIYEGYIGFCGDGHGDIQYLTVYEPTCEQDGYIIGVCEYCSVILEEIHIEATGHKYERTVAIDPTETTVGVEKFTCTACGESYSVYSPALGGDISEKTLCNITGTAVIANSKTADTGVTPLKSVSVKLGDETLATTDSNGNFSFSLETGVYELTLWYNYGFERAVYLVVEDKDVDIGTVPLVACDWNKDGRIDDGDMELFKFVISSKVGDPAYLDYVDMNNDGKIDVKDLVYMNYVKGQI